MYTNENSKSQSFQETKCKNENIRLRYLWQIIIHDNKVVNDTRHLAVTAFQTKYFFYPNCIADGVLLRFFFLESEAVLSVQGKMV